MQGPLPTNSANSINEYDFSVLEEIQPKEFNFSDAFREMLFYSLPLFSFGFFLLILLSGVIPNINAINDNMSEIETLNVKSTALKQRIVNIQNLGENNEKIKTTIDRINSIVPTGRTEVVKFKDRISFNIAQQQLTNSSITTGETILVEENNAAANSGTESNTELDSSTLPLSQIPTDFDVQGELDGVRNFFKELYKGQDFFIVSDMELNKDGDNSWVGDITLVKYQFSPSPTFDPVKAYMAISEKSEINPVVLQFLEKKFIGNVFEDQQVNQ